MGLISSIWARRGAITAILCAIGLVLVVVIVLHEISDYIYAPNGDIRETLYTALECRVSASTKGHQAKPVAYLWCSVRYGPFSKFIHRFMLVLLRNCDNYVLNSVYNSYLTTILITGLVLCTILMQIITPILSQLTPLLAIYSILTWTPIYIAILPFIGYKSAKSTSAIINTLILQPWLLAFVSLAVFKFLKVLVHTASFYLLTNPAQQPVNPTLYPNDVTVIVPSVGEFDDEFIECIETILANKPKRLIVCTVGLAKLTKARDVCSEISSRDRSAKITVLSVTEPNKRAQFIKAVTVVKTQIIAYADDHVFWPPTFLKSALAPFEDQRVGIVGTIKKVRRDRSGGFWSSFMNYIACMYLERHNFECTASYNLDGGVFVISGRTALTRTNIVHQVEFRQAFLNEKWFWGAVGPLKVDDDNCITRWMVNHGWKTVFHNSSDAIVETTLGTTGGLQKFRGRLIRWVRTTWRSNSTSLLADRTCWRVHPWTTYAMFISSFFNIALIYDPLLVLTLYRSGHTQHIYTLIIVLLASKLIKPLEHLRREPGDMYVMLPLGLLFGYVHSFFKIWAFFTAGNIDWSGRKGIK